MNSYTCTEAWPAHVTMEYDRDRPTALGRPQGTTRVLIGDPGGPTLPPNVVGEIWLSADVEVSREYWNAGEVLNEGVFKGGWTRTGDLGYLDPEGYLFLTDRKADTVNVRGYNVSTVEVEFALMEHPAVQAAAVLGMPDPVDGQRLTAAIVLDSHVEASELQRFLRARLSAYKVPADFRVMTDLPRTLAGKVKKYEIATIVAGTAAGEYGQSPESA
jgi:acyl-CoA synthetase (AMP-forming)/AMP-acid ligase II